MKNKTPLPIETHQEIAAIVSSRKIVPLVCEIINHYGKTSAAAKMAVRLERAAIALKSEMENQAYRDGYGERATEIYYPGK
jgi:hypothetical protein